VGKKIKWYPGGRTTEGGRGDKTRRCEVSGSEDGGGEGRKGARVRSRRRIWEGVMRSRIMRGEDSCRATAGDEVGVGEEWRDEMWRMFGRRRVVERTWRGSIPLTKVGGLGGSSFEQRAE